MAMLWVEQLPGQMMRSAAAIVAAALGEPTKVDVVKLVGWAQKRPGLDVVVQSDSPAGEKVDDYALVWVPFVVGTVPPFAEMYRAGRGRHSGVARFASLAKNRDALKLRVGNSIELTELSRIVHDLAE